MLRHLFTARAGGVSAAPYDSLNLGHHVGDDPAAVAANRARLGVDPERIVWMDQVHSTTVRVVDAPAAAPLPATDAVVTDRPGVVLAVLVADCVPVLLGDAEAGVVAAVHAGRKGAAAGIVPAALETMVSLGARPERVTAWLGPAAGGASYEVPAAMSADVERTLPGSRSTTTAGTCGLDLRRGLAAQLRAAGVAEIHVDPADTIADARFFSHRREGTTGRQAGLVWCERGLQDDRD